MRARNLVRAAPRAPTSPCQRARLRLPPLPPPLLAGLWDAYGIGANDVANAFSTSVNSGVFTMAQVGVVVRGRARRPCAATAQDLPPRRCMLSTPLHALSSSPAPLPPPPLAFTPSRAGRGQ